MSSDRPGERAAECFVLVLALLSSSCEESIELRVAELPNRDFPVAFLGKLGASGIENVLGPFGIEGGRVTHSESPLTLPSLESDQLVLLGLPPESYAAWSFEPTTARLRPEPEPCQEGRRSNVDDTDRLRIPVREPTWTVFRASPEAPAFVETDFSSLAPWPELSMEAEYDAEPCRVPSEVQISPWSRNANLLPTLLGIFSEDPVGVDDRMLRQFNEMVPIDDNRALLLSFAAVYLLDRRETFADQSNERVGLHQMLRRVSRQIEPSHPWRLSDIEVVPRSGGGKVFVTGYTDFTEAEGFVAELSFDETGLSLVTTSSVVPHALRAVLVEADGQMVVIADDGLVYTGREIASLAPTLQIPGRTVRAISTGLPEPRHLVGGATGFVLTGDLFGSSAQISLSSVWPAGQLTSLARLPIESGAALWVGNDRGQVAARSSASGTWSETSISLPPRLAPCSISREGECGDLPPASRVSGIELGMIDGRLFQILALEDCPELILRDLDAGCVTSVGTRLQTPGHMQTLARYEDEVWIAGSQSEIWVLSTPRP